MIEAVITGDLVGSSLWSPSEYGWATQRLERVLNETKSFLSNKGAKETLSELYRGDSFQLSSDGYEYIVTAAVLIKLGLLSQRKDALVVNCTLSVGVGQAMAKGKTLGRSQGEPFLLSGRGLEQTGKGELSFHCLAEQSPNQNQNQRLTLLNHVVAKSLALCDVILNGLTEKQSRLLYQDIINGFPTNAELSKHLDMSEQSASNIKSRVGAKAIYQYLDMIQMMISHSYMSKE